MANVVDEGIAIRRMEYAETSQIIVFLTKEHGKIRAISKGARRSTKTRFSPGIDLLDIGRLIVNRKPESSSTLSSMTEWKQIRALSGLREKLFRLRASEYIAEITARLTEDWDSHPGLYDAVINCLEQLEQAQEPLESTIEYQRRLLSSVGSLPVFDRCVGCGVTSNLLKFSSFEGGMMCNPCSVKLAERRSVSASTLSVLQDQSPAAGAEGAFALLNYHIAHLMGHPPLLAHHLVSPEGRRLISGSKLMIDHKRRGP